MHCHSFQVSVPFISPLKAPYGCDLSGGKFVGGLISGGETVAVVVQEAQDAQRTATATVLATKAGTWGIGVYVQISETKCPPLLSLPPSHAYLL